MIEGNNCNIKRLSTFFQLIHASLREVGKERRRLDEEGKRLMEEECRGGKEGEIKRNF